MTDPVVRIAGRAIEGIDHHLTVGPLQSQNINRMWYGGLDVWTGYGISNRGADPGRRIVVGVVEVILAIGILSVIVFNHGGVAKRFVPARRPARVFPGGVLPVLRLPQDLR